MTVATPIGTTGTFVLGDGINVRFNPNTGLLAGTDTPLNGLPAGSTGVTGAAYTNSYGQSLTGGVDTLYTLDAASDRLFIQTRSSSTAGLSRSFR
jgi:hypothetical protein